MATGKERHQAYLDALAWLGKDLARRAKRKCELTGESGRLEPVDLIGAPTEPELDHVVLVTPEMAAMLRGDKVDPDQLRTLEHTVWTDLLPVRVAAVRLLRRVDAPWAREAVENAQTMGPVDLEDA